MESSKVWNLEVLKTDVPYPYPRLGELVYSLLREVCPT